MNKNHTHMKYRQSFGRVACAMGLLGMSGCAQFTYRRQGPESAPIIRGPAITNNSTLLEPLFACYRDALLASGKGAEPLSISVGEVRDYTGKSSINEGAALTQGATLMVMSALGRISPAVRLHERFDPRVGELELIYADRRQLGDGRAYGVPGGAPDQMQRVPWVPYAGGTIMNSRYFIVGGITELNWNVQSAGLDARVDGAGPAARTFTASIGADLRIVDTRSLVVLRTVSLQKQVTGHEVDVNIFRFIGNRLFDISGGTKNQEPIQLAVRATLEMGVLELLASVSGVSYEGCASTAVEAGMLSSSYDLTTPRTAAVSPVPPFVPVPLPTEALMQSGSPPAPARAAAPAPRAPRGIPLPPPDAPQASRPDAAMRPAIPSFLQGPQLLPPPGSLSLSPSGAGGGVRPPLATDPSAYPDPQRQSQPAVGTEAPPPRAEAVPERAPAPLTAIPEADRPEPPPPQAIRTLGSNSATPALGGKVAERILLSGFLGKPGVGLTKNKPRKQEPVVLALGLPF